MILIAGLFLLSACTTSATSEQNYVTAINEHNLRLQEVLTNAPFPYDEWTNYDEWTTQVVKWGASIRTLAGEAINMKPPTSMEHIHAKYSQGMEHFRAGAYLIEDAVVKSDQSLLDQGSAEMKEGTRLLLEAAELRDKFIDAHSKQ